MAERTLYKKDSKGRIQQWTIELQNGGFRTIEGLKDGKLTASEWTLTKVKNEGRTTATTKVQQAVKEAEAKIKKKQDQGWRFTIEELDSVVSHEAMLAHKFEGDEDLTGRYSQPKLDGVRCKAYRDGTLLSRNNKPIVAVPHITEMVKNVFKHLPEETSFIDGELYNHDLKEDFNEIISMVRKTKLTEEDIAKSKALIQYHIYDLSIPGKDFLMRQLMLNTCTINNGSFLKLVDTFPINNKEHLDKLYAEYLEQGYEGQMIRTNTNYEGKRTNALLKRKEFIDKEFMIVDIIEGDGNRSGMMGRVAFQTKDGMPFFSNARGTYEYFKELLKNREEYIGKLATVRYQNLTPDGIPRFPVMISVRDYE